MVQEEEQVTRAESQMELRENQDRQIAGEREKWRLAQDRRC